MPIRIRTRGTWPRSRNSLKRQRAWRILRELVWRVMRQELEDPATMSTMLTRLAARLSEEPAAQRELDRLAQKVKI